MMAAPDPPNHPPSRSPRSWRFWLATFIGLILVSQGMGVLLILQQLRGGGVIVVTAGWVLAFAWLCYGFWAWRTVPWVRKASVAVLASVACVGAAIVLWNTGPRTLSIVIAGVWAMTAAFVGGLAMIRFVLGYGHPVTGVARTLVDEAIRMKVALVFIVGIILLVPVLPVSLASGERLEYRIQTFLTYSVSGMSVLLSLMTIFLACGTISTELQQKQIFLTMTKPIGRAQYLAGKWLGIALLNLLLVSVSGLAVYSFTWLLAQQPAMEAWDRVAVDEKVLVARESVLPQMPPDMNRQSLFVERFRQLYGEDPVRWGGEVSLNLDDPAVLNNALQKLPPQLTSEINTAVEAKWHSIAPRARQTYRFTGLQGAGQYTDTVQLRFKAQAYPQPEDKRIYFGMWLNGRPYPYDPVTGRQQPVMVSADDFHVLPIPVSEIDANGTIDITLSNENRETQDKTLSVSVGFKPGKGLAVLYRVGGFEANLTRTLLILWLRLVFLGMLGLAASTFLGFPVACLFSLLIYVTAISAGFLAESLESFASSAPSSLTIWQQIVWTITVFFSHLSAGEIWEAVKMPIALLGDAVVLLIPSFSKFNPVPLMADGMLVSWELLRDAALWLGLVSTGVCAVTGLVIFRCRELARVIV
ncbi:MAG: hypothetical protein K8S99_14810 [Planctomycetes bacterium]|nr:hypothetical protein [Planctomycetota bacterium]